MKITSYLISRRSHVLGESDAVITSRCTSEETGPEEASDLPAVTQVGDGWDGILTPGVMQDPPFLYSPLWRFTWSESPAPSLVCTQGLLSLSLQALRGLCSPSSPSWSLTLSAHLLPCPFSTFLFFAFPIRVFPLWTIYIPSSQEHIPSFLIKAAGVFTQHVPMHCGAKTLMW